MTKTVIHHGVTSTRHMAVGIGICLLAFFTGCTIKPLDGSSHPSNDTSIEFIGLTPDPMQTVSLEVFNPYNGNWEEEARRSSDPDPLSSYGLGDRSFGLDWYPVSFNLALPDRWHRQPDGRYALSYRMTIIDDNDRKMMQMPAFKSLPEAEQDESLYDYYKKHGSETGFGTIYTDDYTDGWGRMMPLPPRG